MVSPLKSAEAQRPLMMQPPHLLAMRLGVDLGSYLERKMGMALLALITDPDSYGSDDYVNMMFKAQDLLFEEMPPIADIHEGVINILPEAGVGPYRMDFAIMAKAIGSHVPVTVDLECDGAEYHDKSRAQFSHDRERDRFMSARDIMPMRFTYDEISDDPERCACIAIETAMRLSLGRSARR